MKGSHRQLFLVLFALAHLSSLDWVLASGTIIPPPPPPPPPSADMSACQDGDQQGKCNTEEKKKEDKVAN